MITSTAFALTHLLPDQMKVFSQALASSAIFGSNFFFGLNNGYFDSALQDHPILHTWSLSVEEQFYLFFPPLLLVTHKYGRPKLASLLAIIGFVSFAMALIYRPPMTAFFFTPSRIWELLLGATATLLQARVSSILKTQSLLKNVLLVSGISLLIGALFIVDKNSLTPGWTTLLPTFGTTLFLVVTAADRGKANFFNRKVLVGTGLISYSLYLWHQPVLSFARLLSSSPLTGIEKALLIAVVFAISIISWRFVETPMRHGTGRLNALSLRSGLGLSIVVLALGLSLNYHSNVIAQAIHCKTCELVSPRHMDSEDNDRCFLLSQSTDASFYEKNGCAALDINANQNVLLIGDSHAASLFPGLKKDLEKHRIHLTQMTSAACLPLVRHFPSNPSHWTTERCEKINREVFNLIHQRHFNLVIVAAFYHEWMVRNNPEWSYPAYAKDFEDQIRAMTKERTQLLLVGPFPIWQKDLPAILQKEASAIGTVPPEFSDSGIDQSSLSTDTYVQQIALRNHVGYVSTIATLCHVDKCRRIVPSTYGLSAIAVDYGHLSQAGSEYIGREIVGPAVRKQLGIFQ